MKFLYDEQAIIACSTSMSTPSALAVIRLSGFKNLSDLQQFFSFDLSKAQPRYAHLTDIISHEKKLDEAVLLFFPAPNSYTGENLLELSVHGNPLGVQQILEAFLHSRLCRLASEGEFTYRALKNNKLSLSQVEGLDLVLNAKSTQALSEGLSLMHGDLHEEYLKLYESFLSLKASIELSIDFLEDVGEPEAERLLQKNFSEFGSLISQLERRTQSFNSDLLNPSIVLLGQTNAGKSSFFNAFLNMKRAIVSAIPGTTRDFISEYVQIRGANFRLIDTAGLRSTQDPIELEGIASSLEIFKKAFFKVLVLNPFETSFVNFKNLNFDEVDALVVTHADCEHFKESFEKFVSLFPEKLPKYFLSLGSIEPALFSGSIEPLFHQISIKLSEAYKSNPLLVERHRLVINKISCEFSHFLEMSKSTKDIGIISHELRYLQQQVEELLGVISSTEVLDSIFSRFCIGK